MESQHNGKLEPEKETEATSVEIEEIKLPNIEDILKETSLEKFKPKFEEEGVSTEDMIEMTEKDLKEAMKDFGIKRLGDRFRLLNKLRSLKVNMKSMKQKESDEEHEDNVEETEVEETQVEVPYGEKGLMMKKHFMMMKHLMMKKPFMMKKHKMKMYYCKIGLSKCHMKKHKAKKHVCLYVWKSRNQTKQCTSASIAKLQLARFVHAM